MGLKDALDTITTTGRGKRCRICHLLDTLPPDEAAALSAFFDPVRNLGPKPIADVLNDEGYGDLYHSVKQHMYVCMARS